MCNRAEDLHRQLPKWFVTGENAELHVRHGAANAAGFGWRNGG
jgi:hypothetical protein